MNKSAVIFPFVFFGVISQAVFNQDKINDWLAISSKQEVGQTFVADEDNLFKIRIFSRNPQLANKDEVIFTLKKNEEIAREVVLNGQNVGWDYPLNIEFTPILSSKDTTYYFSLKSPTEDETKTITLGYDRGNQYPRGTAMVNNKPIGGDLYFVTFYKSSAIKLLSEETNKATNHLLKDRFFLTLYLILLFMLAAFFLKELKKEKI
jgi:hypothetical protein